MAIRLPWLRGDIDGFTRSNTQRGFGQALIPIRESGSPLEDGRVLAPYPEPARLSYFEQNFDQVMNRFLRAIRPDEEVEGTFIRTILQPMSDQDASDDTANHIGRRSEILNYHANIDARLMEIELELRELAGAISDKTLLERSVTEPPSGIGGTAGNGGSAANGGPAGGHVAANNAERILGGAA